MSLTTILSTLKMPLNSVGGLLTTLVTIAGGAYAFQNYREALPALVVEADSLQLRASVDLQGIYSHLLDIENQYGRVTADKINDMKKVAAHLSYDNRDSIELLLKMVYENIDEFQTTLSTWTAAQIFYLPDGRIMWPDKTEFDLVHNDKAGKLFPDYIDEVRRDPTHVTEKTTSKIKEQAFSLYQPFGQNNDVRLKVADELRIVRSKLEQLKDLRNYFVEAKFTLINESTTSSFLVAMQKAKLNDADSTVLDLRIISTEQRKLEGRTINLVRARSRPFSELKINPALLFQFFKKQGHYSLEIDDLTKKRWAAVSTR